MIPEKRPGLRSQRVAIITASMGKQEELFTRLMAYSDRYMISFQMWPDQYAIYIAKDDVELHSTGSSNAIETMTYAVNYLDRINRVNV
jgi:hypothetical protein